MGKQAEKSTGTPREAVPPQHLMEKAGGRCGIFSFALLALESSKGICHL